MIECCVSDGLLHFYFIIRTYSCCCFSCHWFPRRDHERAQTVPINTEHHSLYFLWRTDYPCNIAISLWFPFLCKMLHMFQGLLNSAINGDITNNAFPKANYKDGDRKQRQTQLSNVWLSRHRLLRCDSCPHSCWLCLGSFTSLSLNQVFYTWLPLSCACLDGCCSAYWLTLKIELVLILWNVHELNDITSQKIVLNISLLLALNVYMCPSTIQNDE